MATKDGQKTGGRTAGTPNKLTGTVKEAYLEVFENIGGVPEFQKWVKSNKTNTRIFYTAFLKMLPRELHVANGESPDSLPFRLLIESEEKHDSNS